MKNLIILSVILFLPGLVTAQDLTKDSAFFEKQTIAYQQWLNSNGMGNTLQIHSIEVEPQQLSLYLQFPFEDSDSVTMGWKQLKQDFEAENDLRLEEKLFYRMLHLMEVRQSMANIQLYDTYNLRLEPCFERVIYFENGGVRVDSGGCKSQIREIHFQPNSFYGKETTLEEIKKHWNRHDIFEKIENFTREYYQSKLCKGEMPKVQVLQSEPVLRIKVYNLCREVLADQSQPFWCAVMRRLKVDCDWAKREMLNYTITYKELENGIRLTIEIQGKYGNGSFGSVGRNGYIDMELDFKKYIEEYADLYRERLKKMLLQKP